jgi:hypothetical protein
MLFVIIFDCGHLNIKFDGAPALSITTFSITTHSKKALNIMTLSLRAIGMTPLK